jgi:aminoglycoside phosphotransferase family enzyme
MSQNTPELIQFLETKFTSSELFQTHISFVVVGEEKTFKVKKPMNFGFLNFETPELRKEFCLEELRLNSKMAPTLYNKVWAVKESGNGLELHEDLDYADNVDYVLEMNSFKQDELFSNLFKEHKLTDEHFTELAKTLADFHANKATCNEETLSYGSFENVQQIAKDNLELSGLFIGKSISQDDYDKLEKESLEGLELLRPVIEQRVADKKTKECHGDLHLNNICVYEGKVTPFDCIEFNKDFRFIDTMYDVSFLYMDLVYNNAQDQATHFLNKYLEFSNDFEGLKLFPMYCSMRAIIRAKVTSLLLNDENISQEDKDEALKTASAYYQLGLDFLKKKEVALS